MQRKTLVAIMAAATTATTLNVLCYVRPAHADSSQAIACRQPRKVACPAVCTAPAVPQPSTQQCIYSKQQYTKDGKGCVGYAEVCWCGVPCPAEPNKDIKL